MKKQIQIITGTEIDVVKDEVNNFLNKLSKQGFTQPENIDVSFRVERLNSYVDSYSKPQYIFVIEYIEE